MTFSYSFEISDYTQPLTIEAEGGKQPLQFGSIDFGSYARDLRVETGPANEIINLHIGRFCSIAHDVKVQFNLGHDYRAISTAPTFGPAPGYKRKGQILIGNDVWIGSHVFLLPGVRIGNGAVVGAGSVVDRDVPPYAIVTGNRMEIVKYRFSVEQIEKLLAIRFWNWSLRKVKNSVDVFKQGDVDLFIEKYYKEPENEVEELKLEARKNRILLIPDFESAYPVWPKVVREYCEKFDDSQDITLVLRIYQGPLFEKCIDALKSVLPQKKDLPDILVFDDRLERENSLFKSCKYFITTRAMNTMQMVEMADINNCQIISGVDQPVFDNKFVV